MNNQVTINKDNILNAYKQASEEQKELLENMFGKDMFHPKDIKGRVKTFNDAFRTLGDKHELVKDYKNLIVCDCFPKDIFAYAKLRIIAEALNEGWEPTFDKDECRYYPWFYIYTKDEYDKLDDRYKKYCNIVSDFIGNKNSRVYSVYVSNVSSLSDTNIGSHLAFKTRELADYCGKQFIDIWAEFLFA